MTALLFISTDLQKGRRGGSLSNTKEQSTDPVQKPTANEDREPESTDQTLASFRRVGLSTPTEVCSHSQREGDVLSISCLCVCVCARACVSVCVRVQI